MIVVKPISKPAEDNFASPELASLAPESSKHGKSELNAEQIQAFTDIVIHTWGWFSEFAEVAKSELKTQLGSQRKPADRIGEDLMANIPPTILVMNDIDFNLYLQDQRGSDPGHTADSGSAGAVDSVLDFQNRMIIIKDSAIANTSGVDEEKFRIQLINLVLKEFVHYSAHTYAEIGKRRDKVYEMTDGISSMRTNARGNEQVFQDFVTVTNDNSRLANPKIVTEYTLENDQTVNYHIFTTDILHPADNLIHPAKLSVYTRYVIALLLQKVSGIEGAGTQRNGMGSSKYWDTAKQLYQSVITRFNPEADTKGTPEVRRKKWLLEKLTFLETFLRANPVVNEVVDARREEQGGKKGRWNRPDSNN